MSIFLSTPSARRATWEGATSAPTIRYFYPRPPRGGRHGGTVCVDIALEFLSTPSARRATSSRRHRTWGSAFLSTPSARRATGERVKADLQTDISIHALREEGDGRGPSILLAQDHFYPRPPRGGRPLGLSCGAYCVYFYPRPPRGGRLILSMSKLRARTISIHALREEGDDLPAAERAAGMGFLSTPSARRATSAVSGAWTAVTEFLSTPSARRATLTAEDALGELADFYPRPPRGGRPL